jgi:hypothetical protein
MALRVERDSGPICPKLRDKRTPIGCQTDAIDPKATGVKSFVHRA